MTQYYLTYNSIKHDYLVWDEKQILCRVSNITPSDENWKRVAEFLQQEYDRTKQPLEIKSVSDTDGIESILKAVDGIRKK